MFLGLCPDSLALRKIIKWSNGPFLHSIRSEGA